MAGIKKEYQLVPDCFDDTGRPFTVLGMAAQSFARVARISTMVIVVPPEGDACARHALTDAVAGLKYIHFVTGGKSRQASVYQALKMLASASPDYVLIHDGARPWVDEQLINRIIDASIQFKAVIPVLPLIETPKECDRTGFIIRHLKRSTVVLAQTPQGFSFKELFTAHKRAKEQTETEYTDDAEIWGEWVGPVATIPGSATNRKVTFSEDLIAVPSYVHP
jgi:2-C-methyl-D-erythritol 4-phosphate cytidylyltransferase